MATSTNLPVRTLSRPLETSDTPCVLLLDLPPAALAGIDLLSFTTSPRFKGIKDVLEGFHFVFCSSTNELSVRHGAWFFVPPSSNPSPPLFVKKWNPSTEHLECVDELAEQLRWRANLGSIWKEGLTPYRQNASEEPTEEKKDWEALTDAITPALLTKIIGGAQDHWNLTTASSAKQDLEAIPGLSASSIEALPERNLNFLPINLKQPWREGATGRERTEAALDHTWYLQDIVKKYCQGQEAMQILGEMQLCFLMVLSLNNYSCLEQWKRILRLLLTCYAAVEEYPEFFVKMLSTLKLQLQHCQVAEGGLFDLADESGSLLKKLLHKFKIGLKDVSGMGKSDVVDELDELENYLRGEHGWQIDSDFLRKGMLELEDGEKVEMDVPGFEEEDESGEYAPTIVDLSEEEMAALGITPGQKLMVNGHSSHEEKYEQEIASEDDQDLEDMDERY